MGRHAGTPRHLLQFKYIYIYNKEFTSSSSTRSTELPSDYDFMVFCSFMNQLAPHQNPAPHVMLLLQNEGSVMLRADQIEADP